MKAPSTDEAHAAIWSRLLNVARHLSGRPPVSRRQRPLLVQLRRGAAENPVYFIGFGLWELRLAELICSDHSIFAIEVPWPSAWRVAALENRTPALPTMEELVAPCLSALSAHALSSPCVVAGASFNGLMAFEVAHQFNRRGGKVRVVMLLDPKANYPTPARVWWEKLKQDWKRKAKLRPTDGNAQTIWVSAGDTCFSSTLEWMFVSELKLLWRRFKAARGDLGELTAISDDLGNPLPWVLVERVYANAANNYPLERLDSRGVLFRADPSDDRPARVLDGTLGWQNLFGRGTGDHPSDRGSFNDDAKTP
jgi:hypothetical protein